MSEALEALLDYEQADMDGVIVKASRQAIHEVADEIERLTAELAKHQESEFHPDWSLLEATRESLREHQKKCKSLTAEVANLKRLLEEGGRRVELMLIPALTKNISGVVTPEASEAWVKEVKQALSTDSGSHQP